MYEFFEDDKRYFLVTDICNGGELFDTIEDIFKKTGQLTERQSAVIIK